MHVLVLTRVTVGDWSHYCCVCVTSFALINSLVCWSVVHERSGPRSVSECLYCTHGATLAPCFGFCPHSLCSSDWAAKPNDLRPTIELFARRLRRCLGTSRAMLTSASVLAVCRPNRVLVAGVIVGGCQCAAFVQLASKSQFLTYKSQFLTYKCSLQPLCITRTDVAVGLFILHSCFVPPKTKSGIFFICCCLFVCFLFVFCLFVCFLLTFRLKLSAHLVYHTRTHKWEVVLGEQRLIFCEF